MRTVSGQSCGEDQNAHFILSNPPRKIVSFMIWCGKSMVRPDRPQMTV